VAICILAGPSGDSNSNSSSAALRTDCAGLPGPRGNLMTTATAGIKQKKKTQQQQQQPPVILFFFGLARPCASQFCVV
jgi:hypothetical protein